MNDPSFDSKIDTIIQQSKHRPVLLWQLKYLLEHKLLAALIFSVNIVFLTCCLREAILMLGIKYFLKIFMVGLLMGMTIQIIDYFNTNIKQINLFN